MQKDIDKKIKRLIHISELILDEFETLSVLSYQDKEETKEFDDHIESVKSFLNSEAVILNNMDLDTLKEIYRILPEYDDDSQAYERTHVNIDDKIEELQYQNDDLASTEETEDADEEVYSHEDDDEFDIERYYLDDEENEKYEGYFVNYIQIFVLKRIYDRILNTTTDNKNDNKYKKRLLKHLKTFKYLVFAQNVKMENIGVKYRFNINKIPYLSSPNIDVSTMSYNHCILLLEKLYNPIDGDNDFDDIYIRLFNMMCFETYLNNVDSEQYYKLLAVCDELKTRTKNTYYGDVAKQKILAKTKN